MIFEVLAFLPQYRSRSGRDVSTSTARPELTGAFQRINLVTACAKLTLPLLKDRQRSEQNIKRLLSIARRTACGFQNQNSLALSSDDLLGLQQAFQCFLGPFYPLRRDRNCKRIATRGSPRQLQAKGRRASSQ